jgi:5-methylcytosine-specific restriction endonuclease McrA
MDEALQELIRTRSGGCCEYRRLPEQFSSTPFEIDHILPEQHGGKTIAGNLALACFACNHHKGPNLAGIDPKTARRTWLFHPRRHK